MAVNYKKLFHLMIEKNLSNSDLQRKAGFSGNILTQPLCFIRKHRKHLPRTGMRRG